MNTKPAGNNLVEAVCQGSLKEMGFAQGEGVSKKIHSARHVLAQLEAFRLQQPWWMPYRAYRRLADFKATQFLAQCNNAEMNQRLAGIAEGAGISLPAICLFNAMEPLLSAVGGCTACPGACSAVAVRGRRSATGEPMVARNFDYLPLVQPFYIVRESRPKSKLRALEFTTVPLAGAVDGMNEEGLCIVYNYAFTIDEQPNPAPPISIAISEALERCGTVTEAAEWIAARPRCGGGILMLCDASGDVASLELSSTRSHLRRPSAGEDVLFHSNAFSSSTMREVQVPWDAIFTNKAARALRGRSLHESSALRDKRFFQLLEEADVIDVSRLGNIMADHGPENMPSDNTPCVHGSYWFTTACLQFFPKERRMRVAYSSACCADFEDVCL